MKYTVNKDFQMQTSEKMHLISAAVLSNHFFPSSVHMSSQEGRKILLSYSKIICKSLPCSIYMNGEEEVF